jgi:hypothetical protein
VSGFESPSWSEAESVAFSDHEGADAISIMKSLLSAQMISLQNAAPSGRLYLIRQPRRKTCALHEGSLEWKESVVALFVRRTRNPSPFCDAAFVHSVHWSAENDL